MSVQTSSTKPAYPPDWAQIAYQVKQDAHWTCQACGITHGEDPYNNLTVHHIDHDTFNNDPSNLVALCQKCHLRIEGAYRRHNLYFNEVNNQLRHGQRIFAGFATLICPQLNIPYCVSPRQDQEPGTQSSRPFRF